MPCKLCVCALVEGFRLMLCALATEPQLNESVTPKLLDAAGVVAPGAPAPDASVVSLEESSEGDGITNLVHVNPDSSVSASADSRDADADADANGSLLAGAGTGAMEFVVVVEPSPDTDTEPAFEGSFLQRIILNESNLWKGILSFC